MHEKPQLYVGAGEGGFLISLSMLSMHVELFNNVNTLRSMITSSTVHNHMSVITAYQHNSE